MSPQGPGKAGEYFRWAATLVITATVAYFAAQSAIKSDIAAIKATQEGFQGEVLRRLETLQIDIREIRRDR